MAPSGKSSARRRSNPFCSTCRFTLRSSSLIRAPGTKPCWPSWMTLSPRLPLPKPGAEMPEVQPQIAGPEVVPTPTPLFEAAVAASLALAVLCLLLFGWLGREVLAGDTVRFDNAIRSWVHQFASSGMTSAMKAVSLLGYEILLAEVIISLIVFA